MAAETGERGPGERVERLRQAMERERLDALVCRLPENVLLLTGYWPVCGWVYAVLPREGAAACILPDTEEQEAAAELGGVEPQGADLLSYPFGTREPVNQEREIRRRLEAVCKRAGGRRWRRVGFEGGFEQAAPAWNAAESFLPAGPTRRLLEAVFGGRRLVDASAFLQVERAVKTPYEIERIRRANRIANLGLEEFARRVEPEASGVELVAAVEAAVMARGTGFEGARRVRAFAQVAVGPQESFRGWRPAEVSTTRRLLAGEIALLELAVVADGYWCDRTRPRVAGRPGEKQLEVHRLVRQAQAAAAAAAVPGARGAEVDETARRVIREAGYDREFVHITGHGVGYRYHEAQPSLAPWSRDVLAAGMIHSVEPGIYLPGMGGIRVEDEVLVTPEGGEVLGPAPSELA